MLIKKNKKAQVVIFSILFVLFVFLLVLTFFFEYVANKPVINDGRSKILESEATRLSDSLLLPGYPENWNEENVQKIGLITKGVLDIQKINNLTSITNNDYSTSKMYLGIQQDYYIKISYNNLSGSLKEHILNDSSINIIEDIYDHKFVVTRQRNALIQDGNINVPANILVITYSN